MAIYTVTQVSAHLKEVVESDPFLSDLLVEGEVSNLRVYSSGHAYFTLKDDRSLLNCVMFRGLPGTELLANGAAVLAHGRIRFYQARGTTDLVVDLAMAAGAGELALELERLRLALQAEGLFEESRKRPLPVFPKVIGVVTSPAGAVFHDITTVIQRRFPLAELVLSPSRVQGPDAAADIVAALERLNRDGRADVILVARGGGSQEDLRPFNEEAVARAIYASRIPVVSGVGHETDFTIADQVADLRAPTPSAAAELVVPDQRVLRRQLDAALDLHHRAWVSQQGERQADVARLVRRLEGTLPDTGHWRRRVDDVARAAGTALANRLQITRMAVLNRQERIRALDPVATLRRGFAVVQKADLGQVVTSTAQVDQGDPLSITVSDGRFPATVGAGAKPKAVRAKGKAWSETAATRRLF